jgi:hypothetical protein
MLAAEASRDERDERRSRMFFTAYIAQQRLVLAPPPIAARVLTYPFTDEEARVDVVQHLAHQHSWADMAPILASPLIGGGSPMSACPSARISRGRSI